MDLLLVSLSTFVFSAIAAAISARRGRLSAALGAGGCIVASALGLAATIRIAAGGGGVTPSRQQYLDTVGGGGHASATFHAGAPTGDLIFSADPMSVVFLVAIFLLCGLGALYGIGYLARDAERRPVGLHWAQYNLLAAAMATVVLAGNAVMFLLAWEVMSLSSFFPVMFEGNDRRVREAGWIYLLAMHVGTAFLVVFFATLAHSAGTLDMSSFHVSASNNPTFAGLLFAAAFIGFGTKAGLVPLHVWLPEAHPAAPSHVSAVMSGIMIKTGIYGLLRSLTFFSDIPVWWGTALVAAGVVSGVLGVLFALAQHDLKRLLAYHSVENVGIITIGLGLGALGTSTGNAALAALGFAGALLHVVNHALFKGLLFMGAGAVAHAAHTREMDRLGGMLKRMPWTGTAFLVGAVAICGLPPLNGFASEFAIFLSGLGVAASGSGPAFPASAAAVVGLSLIGGLAAACFAKAFGVVFLGEPRTPAAADAREPGFAMLFPMLTLAAACIAVGLLAPFIVTALAPAAAVAAGLSAEAAAQSLSESAQPLKTAIVATVLAAAAGAGIWALRSVLLRRRGTGVSPTWDCGYARPTARMQYTASSFAQPLTSFFGMVLRTRRHVTAPEGIFMKSASLETETPDMTREGLYQPIFQLISRSLSQFLRVQQGRVQLYVLYVALALLALLVWTVRTL